MLFSIGVLISIENHNYLSLESKVPCEIPCEYRKSLFPDARIYHLCHPKIQRPAILVGLESAANYPCLKDPNYLAQFDYTMLYTLNSTVPWTYLEPYLDIMYEKEEAWKKKKNAIASFVSNCNSLSGREEIQKLNYPIHNYGRCFQNMETRETKIQVIRHYKFCNAMENSISEDYITEKVWQALSAGCLPLYKGAPNAKEFLPRNSVIFVDEFTIQELEDYLALLSVNEQMYNSFFEWKKKEFKNRMTNLPKNPKCEMCKVLKSKKFILY